MSKKIVIPVIVIIVAIAAALFVVASPKSPNHKSSGQTTRASLASLNVGPSPWPPEYANLASRLEAINMPLLGAEGTALHIHAHLDIYVHGKQVTVPADIGIPPSGGITPVHTHDTTGIIHIESPDAHAKYTLGQFFDIWGVKLTATSVGGYANTATDTLSVYDNGTPVSDPANLVLAAHHEIVVTYGTDTEKAAHAIPKNYTFTNGL